MKFSSFVSTLVTTVAVSFAIILPSQAQTFEFSTGNLNQWSVEAGGSSATGVNRGNYGGLAGVAPEFDINGFWTATTTFSLPSSSGVTLNFSSFIADDRGVILLNNNVVGSWGINSPGIGLMQLTNGGPTTSFNFSSNSSTAGSGSVSSGFVSGVNTLQFVVNNTNAGISGATDNGGPYDTWLSVQGTVAVTPVPEPESYAMLLAGLGLIGVVSRRRTTAKSIV